MKRTKEAFLYLSIRDFSIRSQVENSVDTEWIKLVLQFALKALLKTLLSAKKRRDLLRDFIDNDILFEAFIRGGIQELTDH